MPVRSTSRSSTSLSRLSQDDIRHDKLLSKILVRIVSELKNRGVEPTADMMDAARRRVEAEWSGSMSERQIKSIAAEVQRAFGGRSKTAMDSNKAANGSDGHQAESKPQRAATPPPQNAPPQFSPGPDSEQNSEARALLRNTTRREREALANAEWIAAAERDRIAGIEGRKNDKLNNFKQMMRQKALFDAQMEEHRQEQERERQRALQRQKEMDEHVANHRYLTRKEKQDAFDKAMKEKKFREAQQQELERQREEARTNEHNEQVKQCMMAREELEKARQAELQRKADERKEWERVLRDNQERLHSKAMNKEREREEDRLFQKNYADQLDRQERERAEAFARKEARARYFQQLADGVASKFMAKEQDLTSKIEAEYNQQLQRALEDERNRKNRLKARTEDCQSTIKRQMQEHEDEKRREREEAKRQADALAAQIAEAKHQEECRRLAGKQEAQRLKEFLATQLQMQHFREARPLETSITRPASRANTMFSPSRYQPSPKPQSVLGSTTH